MFTHPELDVWVCYWEISALPPSIFQLPFAFNFRRFWDVPRTLHRRLAYLEGLEQDNVYSGNRTTSSAIRDSQLFKIHSNS